MRAAWRIVRQRQRSAARVAASDTIDALAADDDLELSYLKRVYRKAFVEAFGEAVKALSPRDRTALALQVIDGLDTDAIGQFFGVHRTTCGRWLARSREQLLRQTRKNLAKSLALAEGECDSIIRLVQSRLSPTLASFLKKQD